MEFQLKEPLLQLSKAQSCRSQRGLQHAMPAHIGRAHSAPHDAFQGGYIGSSSSLESTGLSERRPLFDMPQEPEPECGDSMTADSGNNLSKFKIT